MATDRHGRTIQREHDSFTCRHCGVVTFVNAREKAEDIGGYCRRCESLICGPCVDADRCRPLEVWLEKQERGIKSAIERRRTVQSWEN